EDFPVAKSRGERLPPLRQSRLAPIDLLAAADERHDDRPIRVPVHYLQQDLRLGERSPELPPRLRGVPGALRLIEDDDPVHRDLRGFGEVGVDEAMDVLDEGLDPTARLVEALPETRGAVARERLGEDVHERAIPG